MRRKEKIMEHEKAMFLLRSGEYGTLSIIDTDKKPYGIPVNYAVKENAIYFHCAMKGKKIETLKMNNMASFCVVGYTKIDAEKFTTRYESCIVEGNIEEVFLNEKIMALEELIKKYSPQFFEKGIKYIKAEESKTKIFKIKIEKISGKTNLKT